MSRAKASPELLKLWTEGYNLDCGGYEFSPVDGGLASALLAAVPWPGDSYQRSDELLTALICLELSGREWDYILGERTDADLLVIDTAGGTWLPERYMLRNSEGYVQIGRGELYETDHDCNCHGKLVEWTGAAGEPKEPINPETIKAWWHSEKLVTGTVRELSGPSYWEFTGNCLDSPYPDCDRCDGDGTLESPGGTYALYKRCEHPTISRDARIVGELSHAQASGDLQLTLDVTCKDCGCTGSVAVDIDPDDVEW